MNAKYKGLQSHTNFKSLAMNSHSDHGMHITIKHVTLSHLRSKEITDMHKPCIPHFNAATEYVSLFMGESKGKVGIPI